MRKTGAGADELALAYAEYSRSLLKLAALLVPDIGAAREVVYESFADLYRERLCGERPSRERPSRERNRPHSREESLAFLLRDVVCRARGAMAGSGITPAAQNPADDNAAVIRAVRALPGDQREALVLRYYGQLSDEQAAAAMGVRPTALRANVARGMAALRAVLGPQIVAFE